MSKAEKIYSSTILCSRDISTLMKMRRFLRYGRPSVNLGGDATEVIECYLIDAGHRGIRK